MKLGETTITEEYRGETVTVEVEARVCPKCGYRTIPSDKIGQYGRLLVEAYQEKRGLLTGAEIRRRRESLGMSQEKFAEWLRVGIASVKRWELGAVQDEAMDELIRLRTDAGHAKSNYEEVCQRTGVEADMSRTVIVMPAQGPSYGNYLIPRTSPRLDRILKGRGEELGARLAAIQMG